MKKLYPYVVKKEVFGKFVNNASVEDNTVKEVRSLGKLWTSMSEDGYFL